MWHWVDGLDGIHYKSQQQKLQGTIYSRLPLKSKSNLSI
jgi:hypothetical protein